MVLVKVRVVGYLHVGGVVFGLCGSGHDVFHDVELLCAEWSSSWSRNMCLSCVVTQNYTVKLKFMMVCLRELSYSLPSTS